MAGIGCSYSFSRCKKIELAKHHFEEMKQNNFSFVRLDLSEEDVEKCLHSVELMCAAANDCNLRVVACLTSLSGRLFGHGNSPFLVRTAMDCRERGRNEDVGDRACVNAPEFRRYSIELCKKIAAITTIDGLWISQPVFGVCYCFHCHAMFRKQSGGALDKDKGEATDFAIGCTLNWLEALFKAYGTESLKKQKQAQKQQKFTQISFAMGSAFHPPLMRCLDVLQSVSVVSLDLVGCEENGVHHRNNPKQPKLSMTQLAVDTESITQQRRTCNTVRKKISLSLWPKHAIERSSPQEKDLLGMMAAIKPEMILVGGFRNGLLFRGMKGQLEEALKVDYEVQPAPPGETQQEEVIRKRTIATKRWDTFAYDKMFIWSWLVDMAELFKFSAGGVEGDIRGKYTKEFGDTLVTAEDEEQQQQQAPPVSNVFSGLLSFVQEAVTDLIGETKEEEVEYWKWQKGGRGGIGKEVHELSIKRDPPKRVTTAEAMAQMKIKQLKAAQKEFSEKPSEINSMSGNKDEDEGRLGSVEEEDETEEKEPGILGFCTKFDCFRFLRSFLHAGEFKYIACSHIMGEYDNLDIPANCEYRDNSERCEPSRGAHRDFHKQLVRINQQRPLRVFSSSEEQGIRAGCEMQNLRTSLAFSRYIRYRQGLKRDPKGRPKRRKIRTGTAGLLSRSPTPDFTLAGLLLLLLDVAGLAYNLYSQISVNMKAKGNDIWQIAFILILKEAVFVTIPAAWILITSLLLVVFVAAFPILVICRVALSEYNWKSFRRFALMQLIPVIRENVSVVLEIIAYCSSIRRIMTQLNAVRRLTVTTSIKDFDAKLARMGNIMFDLGLLVVTNSDPSENVRSLLVSLAGLLLQMVREKVMLKAHYDALRDINENRLSKFEFALYMQKLLDDFIDDKVTTNYVEHFYTDEPFLSGSRRYIRGEDRFDDIDMEYLSMTLKKNGAGAKQKNTKLKNNAVAIANKTRAKEAFIAKEPKKGKGKGKKGKEEPKDGEMEMV